MKKKYYRAPGYIRWPLEKRFWEKVEKSTTDQCWVWMNNLRRGYGVLFIRKGKSESAHRLSWELHYGKIPKGLCILHHCDNPPCVNPKHLFLGTHKENTYDAMEKGRSFVGRKGEKHPIAKFNTGQIKMIRAIKESRPWFTHQKLARMFDVDRSTISCILSRKTWNHI